MDRGGWKPGESMSPELLTGCTWRFHYLQWYLDTIPVSPDEVVAGVRGDP